METWSTWKQRHTVVLFLHNNILFWSYMFASELCWKKIVLSIHELRVCCDNLFKQYIAVLEASLSTEL